MLDGRPRLVLSVGAVIVTVVDLVDPYLRSVLAVEPVDWVAVVVVLLLVCSVIAVLFLVVASSLRADCVSDAVIEAAADASWVLAMSFCHCVYTAKAAFWNSLLVPVNFFKRHGPWLVLLKKTFKCNQKF